MKSISVTLMEKVVRDFKLGGKLRRE